MSNGLIDYEQSRREIELEGRMLRFHEAGEGPPLLLLHGSGIGVGGWSNFQGNLAAFAEHFHCYIIEFPGFGISEPGYGGPLRDAIDSVTQFMDALHLESAAIIGNSMGGVVGARVAMEHPSRVNRLITIGGVGPNILSQAPSEGTRLLRAFTEDPSRGNLVRWIECMVHDQTWVTDDLVEARWLAAQNDQAFETLTAMYGKSAVEAQKQNPQSPDSPPYWSMMHKIDCPTLFTWGLNDRQCPPDMPLVPLRLTPNAELHIFPNCGHWVMMEAKAAFERVTLEFLLR